jgi:hypothetical protein
MNRFPSFIDRWGTLFGGFVLLAIPMLSVFFGRAFGGVEIVLGGAGVASESLPEGA